MLATALATGRVAVVGMGQHRGVPFSAEAFKAAQASGSPILVEIHADWCPTCKAQNPILDKLTADPKFKDLEVFRVDFDVDEAGGQAVRRADAVDADRLQGIGRAGPLGRRHQAGLDRRAARQEPLDVPVTDSGAGVCGRAAVDPVALRAAAGADRARRGGGRPSARRVGAGGGSGAVVHRARPVAGAGGVRARHRCRHVSGCGRRRS